MNIRKLITIVIATVLVSCGSDELTNSKAEDIIDDCLENTPELRTVSIKLKAARLVGETLEKYQKLEEEGYLKILEVKPKEAKPKMGNSNDPLTKWRYEAEIRRYNRNYKDTYNIELTKKAEKFVDEVKETSDYVKMKSHTYEVDEVLEVQEIPSMNTAIVKARFVAEDITPFSVFYKSDPNEFWMEDLKMVKTSNGWKYCDNF